MQTDLPFFFKTEKLTTPFFSRWSNYKLFLFIFLFIPFLSHAGEKSNMRGKRYCEVILARSASNVDVYNTFGLNECPDEVWKKINSAQLKKETGAYLVRLNGPRYWVIDGFKNSTLIDPAVKTFGGLEMRKAGELQIGPSDFFLANIAYHERNIKRHTTWIYEVGKPVYELIDSKGNVYVMQSYSVQQVPQTAESLAQLGTKLKLPPGWKFKTGILKKTETVEAVNNMATVVRDNLLNTYQEATHDLLTQ